ncbi:2' 3'-cyclic-nucleotide 3'-phosphodiesterase [Fasciolopsis buskii]|uniref:2',3'-cyclic-nucleotide 3'-phosphodiesterase n=1 Tax=Fasciolopsis buskii TaxID=27845 RepID=A0A8E0VHR2_9TREM|nr:2' 3'-cyclic-nucleotide 3'-phosphodiesterase [Fasciolopsis buski]
MGNFFVHLCPAACPKVLKRSKHHHSVANHDADTSLLCNEQPVEIESPSNVPSVQKVPGARTTVHVDQPTPTPNKQLFKKSYSLREYVNFPFLTDDELATWIVKGRFMFLMRGPPGSGKSFIAECIKTRFPTTKICSADEFWYLESNGEVYQYDVNRLSEAHEWCHQRARAAAESGVSPLVIDNTNIRAWESRFYTELARRFHYIVIMVTPQTPWRFDTEALAERNVHFVGLEAIESKVRNFEHVFPLYYGWLWPAKKGNVGNNSGSHRQPTGYDPLVQTNGLLQWAWESLVTIVGLPDVQIQLAAAFGLSDSAAPEKLLQHWHSATEPCFGQGLQQSKAAAIPHITAKYARYGRAPGATQYGQSGAVSQSLLGQLSTVQVTGLFISLRSVGVRIRLPADDLILRHLWGGEDQAVLSVDRSAYDGNFNGFIGHLGYPHQEYRPPGCRAHVTMALAPDVSAVETGFDLLRIVDSELAYRMGDHVAIIPGGSVRRVTVRSPAISPNSPVSPFPPPKFGTTAPGYEYIYVFDLDQPQHHRVLFAGVY